MTVIRTTPDPQPFSADGKGFHVIHFHDLCLTEHLMRLFDYLTEGEDEVDLQNIAQMISLNNCVRGHVVYGTHLILDNWPNESEIAAVVSIFPAEVSSVCSAVKGTYDFSADAMVMIECTEEDADIRLAYWSAGLEQASLCIHRNIVSEDNASQTWITITHSKDSDRNSVLETAGWLLRGMRIFTVEGLKGAFNVWSLTVDPVPS